MISAGRKELFATYTKYCWSQKRFLQVQFNVLVKKITAMFDNNYDTLFVVPCN